jgi:hypothetical protein
MESHVWTISGCHTSNDGDQYDEANQVIKRERHPNVRASRVLPNRAGVRKIIDGDTSMTNPGEGGYADLRIRM